jgi:hypothetical protein
MFSVRYELNLDIKCRLILVFKGLKRWERGEADNSALSYIKYCHILYDLHVKSKKRRRKNGLTNTMEQTLS